MEGYSRGAIKGSRRVRYKVGEDTRTAGPSTTGHVKRGRDHTLARIQSGWRRRAGATGVLLAVIAVTIALAG